jgi:tRNA dimethylallyltransferase
MDHRTVILIAGPTASGKSALALHLAGHLGATIINADSMQVYAELRILTARPSQEEERRQPHALYGFVPAAEAYSVGRYLNDAAHALRTADEQGRPAIFVGGTGLYFQALLQGLSPVPPVDPEVRAHWRQQAALYGAAALYEALQRRDNVMAARLSPTDPQRLVRALEVLDSSGRSLADWQQQQRSRPVLAERRVKALALWPARAEVRNRVDRRFDQMMAAGALDEAAALADLQLDPCLPAMRAIGVAPLLAAVGGAMPLADAVQRAKTETHQYIKRQSTWMRRNMIAWKAVYSQETESTEAQVMAFIQS